MSGEIPFTPDEVLATEGPNKGNIKDVEVARAAAEAREGYRESSAGKQAKAVDKLQGYETSDSKEEPYSLYKQGQSIAERDAISQELKSRMPDSMSEDEKVANLVDFEDKQASLTNERIDEEARSVSEQPGIAVEDVLVTEGPNRGNIKDVELAQTGAEAEYKYRKSFGGKFAKLTGGTERDSLYDLEKGNISDRAMGEKIKERMPDTMSEKAKDSAAYDVKKAQHDLELDRIAEIRRNLRNAA